MEVVKFMFINQRNTLIYTDIDSWKQACWNESYKCKFRKIYNYITADIDARKLPD